MCIDIEKFKEWLEKQKRDSLESTKKNSVNGMYAICLREQGSIDAYDFILEQIENNADEHDWIVDVEAEEKISMWTMQKAFQAVARAIIDHEAGRKLYTDDRDNLTRMACMNLHEVK